jgi:actin related protein 2/3 complex subunit 1A/1B
MFRQMDLKGQTAMDTKLKSTHQNTVNTIRVFEEADGQVSSFSSKSNIPHSSGRIHAN